MKSRTAARPSLEALEDRWCPAVSATISGGNLLVSATTASALTIKETAANSFTVLNGSTTVGSISGVTGDVKVNLGSASDTVHIDLGGNTTPHGVTVNLGGGNIRGRRGFFQASQRSKRGALCAEGSGAGGSRR